MFGFGIRDLALPYGKTTPWWHGYRAGPNGPLPAMVFEPPSGRLYGASLLDANTLDLSGLSLGAGVSLMIWGGFDYVLGSSGYATMLSLETASTSANRARIYINQINGIPRLVNFDAGASQAQLTPQNSPSPSGQIERIAARIFPDDFACSINGMAPDTDGSGTVAVGFDRLHLLSHSTAASYPGTVTKVALWTESLSNAQVQALTV